MRMEITLPRNVRTFQKDKNSTLGRRTGGFVPAGTRLVIGAGCTMLYDHQGQTAVPILDHDIEDLYLLVSEIGLPSIPQ